MIKIIEFLLINLEYPKIYKIFNKNCIVNKKYKCVIFFLFFLFLLDSFFI